MTAPTTVTIKAQGTDLSGTVSSPKPKRCAAGRTVLLIKQKGARGGPTTARSAATPPAVRRDVPVVHGNTGIQGRFYAKVKAIPGCKGGTSKTVKATR